MVPVLRTAKSPRVAPKHEGCCMVRRTSCSELPYQQCNSQGIGYVTWCKLSPTCDFTFCIDGDSYGTFCWVPGVWGE